MQRDVRGVRQGVETTGCIKVIGSLKQYPKNGIIAEPKSVDTFLLFPYLVMPNHTCLFSVDSLSTVDKNSVNNYPKSGYLPRRLMARQQTLDLFIEFRLLAGQQSNF